MLSKNDVKRFESDPDSASPALYRWLNTGVSMCEVIFSHSLFQKLTHGGTDTVNYDFA